MANISQQPSDVVDVGPLCPPQLSVDIQPELDLAAVSCGCTSAPFLFIGRSSCSNIMRFIMCPGGGSLNSSNCLPLTSTGALVHFQSAEALTWGRSDAAGASITPALTFTAENRGIYVIIFFSLLKR